MDSAVAVHHAVADCCGCTSCCCRYDDVGHCAEVKGGEGPLCPCEYLEGNALVVA